jgi:hypothetical protein
MGLVFTDTKSETVNFASGRMMDWKTTAKFANTVGQQIVDEQRAKGKADPYSVAVVFRGKIDKKSGRPILRFFNLSPQYPGRLNLCETLISGTVRLATDEEIEAEKVFNKEQRLAALPEFLREDLKGAKVNG